jgi:hypothetical protein
VFNTTFDDKNLGAVYKDKKLAVSLSLSLSLSLLSFTFFLCFFLLGFSLALFFMGYLALSFNFLIIKYYFNIFQKNKQLKKQNTLFSSTPRTRPELRGCNL